jgi:hypothetical protein
MELHAHTHTARKKWTHYFWEFLMLFLAVFCGFLAEYQLEHKIEKEREKDLIKSLYIDLQADTVRLKTIIRNRAQKIVQLDSLQFLLNSPLAKQYGNSIYYNAIHTGRRIETRFTPNDGTLQQLKNAGGLRLIRKRAVVDQIAKYDVSVRNLLLLEEYETAAIESYRQVAHKIFNSSVFENMLDSVNNATRPVDNPSLLPFGTDLLNEFNYSIYTIKLVNKGLRRDTGKLLGDAVSLLATLRKEYHLK